MKGNVNINEVPYISTYYIKPIIEVGEEAKLDFYITDYFHKEYLEDDYSETFTVTLRVEGREDKKFYNLKAGDHTISLGEFDTEGEKKFSVLCTDKYGRNSHELFNFILVKNPVEVKEYIMTQEDLMIYEDIKQEETTSFFKCKELIKKHKLNMNLVQCRLTFDKRKISFYYTAPERVDFRELLKELTQVFKKMRIDLRHIGVRDESSIMDGTGICGKPFCCSSYLRKFESINVKLAKETDNVDC